MKTLSKPAAATLKYLTAFLKPGETRKIDNAPGTYMAVSVECLYEGHYSVSHYFEQNGDLVPDPDMEFYRTESGAWMPVNCTLSMGHFTRALKFDGPGTEPTGYYPEALTELCSFANSWMKNIESQQRL